MVAGASKAGTSESKALKVFLVPCSCGTTFAVPENYDLATGELGHLVVQQGEIEWACLCPRNSIDWISR
jgi:hypothetical protein